MGRQPPPQIYAVMDNLSAHAGTKIRAWVRKNRVELCFCPTNRSWAQSR